MPSRFLNAVQKLLSLTKPVRNAMSFTGISVECKRKRAAAIRVLSTYWWGVNPVDAANIRVK